MRLYWIRQVWHCLYKLCFIDNLILVSFISCSCSNFDNQYIWFSDIVLDVISNIWCQEVSRKDTEFINLKKEPQLYTFSPGISLQWCPIRSNEKLLKVPSNVSSLDRSPDQELRVAHQTLRVIRWSWQLLLQELEYRVLILSISLDLQQCWGITGKPLLTSNFGLTDKLIVLLWLIEPQNKMFDTLPGKHND